MKIIQLSEGDAIASVADLHIMNNRGLRNIEIFCDIMDATQPKALVLDGDIRDKWGATDNQINHTHSWQRIIDTCERRDEMQLDTYYVLGNHDWQAKQIDLPWAHFGESFTFKLGDKTILYIHGWQFDIVWQGIAGIPGIAPTAFFIATRMPWLMAPLYNCIVGKNTPGRKRQRIISASENGEKHLVDTISNDWTKHIGFVHLRAMQYAKAHNLSVVMGHTHCPIPHNGLIADNGNLPEDGIYVVASKYGIKLEDVNAW